MTDARYLETLDPMPAEAGKWLYGKSFLPLLDGRIPVAAPGGVATLGADGKLLPAQRPGDGTFMPTYIPEGQTFVIPENTQALYALPIVVDGTLVIDGTLVEVA